MSENEGKKSRKELHAEIVNLRTELAHNRSFVHWMAFLSAALLLGIGAWHMLSDATTNAPDPIPMFVRVDRARDRLTFEPARVLAPRPSTVECRHFMDVPGAYDISRTYSSWDCSGDNWKRNNVRVYNYTESPSDPVHISCMMDAESRVFPPSCVFRMPDTEEKVSLYFYNPVHEFIFATPTVLMIVLSAVVGVGYYVLTLVLFFVCEITWYAPVSLLAFYMCEKSYKECSSRFPAFRRLVLILRRMVDILKCDTDPTSPLEFFITLFVSMIMVYAAISVVVCLAEPSTRGYFLVSVCVCFLYFGGTERLTKAARKFVADFKKTVIE